eukprot:CAMPEP_0176045892 /NCGR_PEP_ID=MMETSP0120_2-20121206/22784_1 /TAXON_ID=160619 /ORGANISM="Kryptoperidinium foliaceum, Strain CCMP 1326" /LENGTH=982 /DNA_ID=CAMNT_0017379301 /DNA_START=78 /DNA_END=3022 /DNA_ORIENTATION=+
MAQSFEQTVLTQLRLLSKASARIEHRLTTLSGDASSHSDLVVVNPPRAPPSAWALEVPFDEVLDGDTDGELPDVNFGQFEATEGSEESDGMIAQVRMAEAVERIVDARLPSLAWHSGETLALRKQNSGQSGHSQSHLETASSTMQHLAAEDIGEDGFVASSLPLMWPKSLKRREDLLDATPDLASRGQPPGENSSRFVTKTTTGNFRDDFERRIGKMNWLVIDPNAKFYLFYSTTSLAILAFDLTLLPYLLAWDTYIAGFLFVAAWFTPTFWSLDIVLNFFIGHYREGVMVTDLPFVARAYLRSWFVPDALVVLCDWLSLIMGTVLDSAADSRGLRMLRFTKLGRMLRIVGMMRMLRVVRILEDISATHLNEFSRLIFKMISLLTCILWLTHLLACFWFAIGRGGPSDTGDRWVDYFLERSSAPTEPFLDSPLLYQYMVAFHWAAGQIALGSIDINPTNSLERMVFVLAMMFGFLFGSTLVSMLSAAMMDYQMMQKDRTVKLRTLSRYLKENDVPANIAIPVQRQVEQRLRHRESLTEVDVVALELLSVGLRSLLRFEIMRPHLSTHGLFRLCAHMDSKLVQRTCQTAIDFVNLRSNDDLFAPGTVAEAAFVLERGMMQYSQSPGTSPMREETAVRVAQQSWLCEVCLWVEWTHVGKAESMTACQLLKIDPESLAKAFKQDFVIMGIIAEYGKHFHKRVQNALPPHAPWPSDIEVPFTDYCDLVVCMEKSVQLTIGRDALAILATQRSARAIEKLREEVESSKSIVVTTGAGVILRVVSLVVLRAVQADGRVFMQVGKYHRGEAKSAFQLPGVKQEADELVAETLDRMFRTKLSLLRGKLSLCGTTRENQEKESKEYGVQTRYMRSICSARLVDNASLNAVVCSSRGDIVVYEETHRVESMKAADINMSHWLKVLKDIDVYFAPAGEGSGNLYAWLPPDSLDALGSPWGDRALQAWLSQVDWPSQETLAAIAANEPSMHAAA